MKKTLITFSKPGSPNFGRLPVVVSSVYEKFEEDTDEEGKAGVGNIPNFVSGFSSTGGKVER